MMYSSYLISEYDQPLFYVFLSFYFYEFQIMILELERIDENR